MGHRGLFTGSDKQSMARSGGTEQCRVAHLPPRPARGRAPDGYRFHPWRRATQRPVSCDVAPCGGNQVPGGTVIVAVRQPVAVRRFVPLGELKTRATRKARPPSNSSTPPKPYGNSGTRPGDGSNGVGVMTCPLSLTSRWLTRHGDPGRRHRRPRRRGYPARCAGTGHR